MIEERKKSKCRILYSQVHAFGRISADVICFTLFFAWFNMQSPFSSIILFHHFFAIYIIRLLIYVYCWSDTLGPIAGQLVESPLSGE